ncbi:MAG: hypothetical protein DHS20C19_28540 [Acidimicrobiales bacterium]|nr:MAG: hypothetical protein DHS20C19_28540 [Acidimicrobiales bacterium]
MVGLARLIKSFFSSQVLAWMGSTGVEITEWIRPRTLISCAAGSGARCPPAWSDARGVMASDHRAWGELV